MSKVDINRANLVYAHALRKWGYETAVHALPPQARALVDKLLGEGVGLREIANEIQAKYGKYLEKIGLKSISHMSIKAYRDGYWRQTPAFKKMVIKGTEESKKAAEEVLKDFDSYKEMVETAKTRKERVKRQDEIEKMTKLSTKRGDEVGQQYFDMCKVILEKEMELGMRTKAPILLDVEGGVDVEVEDDRVLIKQAEKALAILKGKGRYDRKKPLGEKISSSSSKA